MLQSCLVACYVLLGNTHMNCPWRSVSHIVALGPLCFTVSFIEAFKLMNRTCDVMVVKLSIHLDACGDAKPNQLGMAHGHMSHLLCLLDVKHTNCDT